MNTEAVCGSISVDPESEILMITKAGQTVRCAVQNIRETSRGSKGVKLVNLSQKDFLVGVSEVVELDEKTGDAEQTDATEEIAENNLDSDDNVISDSKNIPD